MKRTIKSLISVIALSAILQPAAQENTVTITSFTDEVKDANLASDDNSITEIRFFDTAGRLRQTLRKGFSPDGSDLVDFIDFDSLGRKCTEFDPMPVGGNNGNFVGRSQFSSNGAWARSFEYELSTQSRPVSVEGQHYGGGIAFYKYGFNNSASSDYKVFTLVPVPGPNCIRVDIVSASPGSYRFVEYKDEDGYRRITFFDPDGKTVLERVIASAGSQDTYYLYDDMDRLLGVLPPAVSSGLSAQSSIFSNYGAPDTFGYWYKYDERNRTIGVKLPGIDWEYTVFDGENRPILRQDGNQRKKGLWTFFKYDELGRIVLEGTVEDSRSREVLAGLWKDRAVKESFSGNQANYGYSDNSRLGQSEYRITAAYYYDRYEFISLDSLHIQNFWVDEQASAHGLMTGKYEAVLNVPGKGRTSIFVYDEKGRIIRSQQLDNLVDPFWTVLETGYDFSGQVLSEEHRYNGRLSLRYDYERDRMGRVTAVSLRYAGRSDAQPVQIPFSELSYDNYGRPTAKKILHDSLILNYSYDPDGGLFSIENPGRVSEQICRSSLVTTPYSLSRCKNGNINDIRISQLGNDYFWHFDYVDGNRLSRAAMYHSNNFNRPLGEEERFAYDNMGNITLLLRTHENRYAEQLDMVYKGNRLTKVSKNGDPNLEYDFQGYPDKADASTEMTYDPNGNMTADLDRGIVAIRYNLLNLPDTVQFENGNRIVYFYYAGGERAGAVTTTYSTPISVPLDSVYLGEDPHFDMWEHRHGNLFYKMGSPSRLLFDDGFFELAERHGGLISQIPYVFVRDHLGSVRLVCNGNTGEVVQSLEYLPSGVIFRSRNFDRQPYRFTGKELLSAHGLDWYDSRARMQEFHIPRFTTMDPLCEKYYSISPYAYCGNNPIKYIDPTGLAPIYAPDGTFLGTDDEGLCGPQLILNKNDFTQGMPHADAQKVLWTGVMTQDAQAKMDEHVAGLSSRPDYDGFVSIAEGIAWAKEHPNALKKPTPDNTLYIDASKLDFGRLSTSDFKNVGEIESQNLFDLPLLKSALLYTLRNTVYALGRVDMILVNKKQKTVRIVNNSATDYDWNLGGGTKRDLFIRAERRRAGLNDTHGFKTFYYGLGRLKK